jgi:Ca2+-binding RTX toxin-like protein
LVTAFPAIRPCLRSLALLICSFTLVVFAAPAEAAKCTKKGTNGDDVLQGSNKKKKKDVLCGRGGNDVLIGLKGNDQLLGGDGDDTLRGGAGNDKLKGEGDLDTASYADSTSSISVNLASGVASGDGDDKLSAVENATGSAQNDTLIGDGADNTLAGGEGNDSLAGGEGADMLDGGAGTDTANFFAAAGAIDADLTADTAGGQGTDSLPGIENVTGSPQADTLAGDPGDNTLHGGAGTDTVSYADATASVVVDLDADTATGAGIDSVPAVENVVGSPQGDILDGDSQDNSLDGGQGSDTVSYADSAASVTVDLANGTATGDGADTLTAIEGATGSDQADALIGDEGDSVLSGGEGDDVIASGAGEDQLSGDEGNDQLFGEQNDDSLDGGLGDDLLDGGSGSDACDGGPGTNQLVGGCDPSAPNLDDFTISPPTVDTSLSSQDITFTLELSDALSGVDPLASQVTVTAPGGEPRDPLSLQLASGDVNDGTFEATISLPRFSPAGTWTVDLELVDEAGNAISWSSSDLIDSSLPGGFQQTGSGDSLAPQLADFSLAPTSIDTSSSSQVLTFAIQAVDGLAGVDPTDSSVSIASPDGLPKGSDQLTLISGDANSGTYEATITVPRLAAQGTWTVSLVLADAADNQASWSSSQLVGDGYPGSFEQTGLGDATGPVLTDFGLTPAQINTSAASRVVTFTLDATDDLSGVDLAASEIVVFSPDGEPRASDPLQLVSGNATDGSYQAAITIPQGSQPGTWTVSVELVDAAANQSTWSSSELIGLGHPGSFTNVGSEPT